MNTDLLRIPSISQAPGFEETLRRLLLAHHHAELAYQFNTGMAEEIGAAADDARGRLIDIINDFVADQVAHQVAQAPTENRRAIEDIRAVEERHVPRPYS